MHYTYAGKALVKVPKLPTATQAFIETLRPHLHKILHKCTVVSPPGAAPTEYCIAVPQIAYNIFFYVQPGAMAAVIYDIEAI